ncbi:MAG: DUF5131 family protein [Pseudonocardiaceae bacterium]
MADKSSIEWTEATWNPTTGCDRITAGCDNCYALTLAKRLKAMGNRNISSTVTRAPVVQVSECRPMRTRWRYRNAGQRPGSSS